MEVRVEHIGAVQFEIKARHTSSPATSPKRWAALTKA